MDQGQPWVVEGCCGGAAQKALGDLAHERVNFTHRDPLHSGVPAHLAQHTAISTADNEHTRRIRVGMHRDVCDHLLVGMLVALGDLDNTIQHEDGAIVGRFEHEHVLEVTATLIQHLLDFK
eukprot:CAMPEP_0115865478 /NCGR_PEP_ID=MMETSP0287-20121206/19741_1 /TAXON_ID=412157 /ORGANISM="Chrysochromulina rotalis, Strain UIO044" /LENGTH=120 /DNA_ID=CAMNT_0003319989 /DNA_START=883 /DNA_END=1245 /DNA_ORIENTATION=+